ncbi:MAG: hypothetical protein OXR73_38075 [Myxococcales bacterium]|nr:hypothetical protein [Myxococcales bacterium]
MKKPMHMGWLFGLGLLACGMPLEAIEDQQAAGTGALGQSALALDLDDAALLAPPEAASDAEDEGYLATSAGFQVRPASIIKIDAYLDLGDIGDDPWNPGYHFGYANKTCAGKGVFVGADTCSSDKLLSEWKGDGCHTHGKRDTKEYNCDTVCKGKGLGEGTCKWLSKRNLPPSGFCSCTLRPLPLNLVTPQRAIKLQ